eukprot:15340355-Ditylum_brightwellii.AAC.1
MAKPSGMAPKTIRLSESKCGFGYFECCIWEIARYLLCFFGGSWEYHGKGITRGLVQLVVEDQQRLLDLAKVMLGSQVDDEDGKE